MRRLIYHYTDSPEFGGAEQALLHLLAGLDGNDWRPVLLYHPSPGVRRLVEEAARRGVELRPIPPMPLGMAGAGRISGFVRSLRTSRPTIFHAHLTWPLACKYGLLGAILARIPVVVATDHLFVEAPYSPAARLQQQLLAACMDGHIAVSHHLAYQLQRTFRISKRRIHVVHNAVPEDRFAHSTWGKPSPLARDSGHRATVLTTARLHSQKGLEYLLRAAVLIPGVQFLIAGDGPERAALVTQAQALDITDRIVFLGHREDVPELLAHCDLFVLPSLYEGLPLSVLEAMTAGKPVIATAVGGTPEAIHHGETGVLVPPADSLALAGAIHLLLADAALAGRLATAGQQRVRQQFSVTGMIEAVTRIYRDRLRARGLYDG